MRTRSGKKMSNYLKTRLEHNEKKSSSKETAEVAEHSIGTKLVLWSVYFATIAAGVAWIAQGSRTSAALANSAGITDTLKALSRDVETFKWESGVTRAGSWQFLAAVHAAYAIALNILMYVMKGIKTRVGWAKAVSKAHNVLMMSLSAFLLSTLVYGGYRDGRFASWDAYCCQKPSHSGLIEWSMYAFYLSKMLEFIDTFLLVLLKKDVILLHKIHHLTTMSLVWHSLETNLPSDIMCAGLNCFVHTIMYAYYAFGSRWLRPHLTSTQILQFVFCLAALGYAQVRRQQGTPCMGTNAAEWHGLVMYGVYLGMFVHFFIKQYCGKRKKSGPDSKKQRMEVILFSKRVDVTSFIKKHPGGTKVLRIFENRDATEQFEAYHSDRAHRWLKALPKRATLSGDNLISETPLAKDFSALIDTFKKKGFYTADIPEEIMKVLMVFVPVIYGNYLLKTGAPLVGCLLMGFGMYYGGWVSHDYLHHAVFRGGANADETTADAVWKNNIMGYVIGLVQGYEVGWWRARHNTHHVVTNEHGNDPDIKTAPLLTYVRNNPSIAAGLNWFQRWQQYYYVPVMSILDVYWRLESIAYIAMRMPAFLPQAAAMTLHYVWMAWAFQGQWKYFWIMTLFRGFGTGIIVFSTHYGEDILDAGPKMTLAEQTSKTSRNITGGYVANLLSGFLSLQTEHHLFPMMPTGNLARAQPYVKEFFKKHNLEYRQGNIFECVHQNIKALRYEHVLGGAKAE